MLRQAEVSGHAHPVRRVHQPGLIIHSRRCYLDSGDFFDSCLGEGKFLQELCPSLPPFLSGYQERAYNMERGEKRQSSFSQLVWVKSDLESCFRIKPLLLLPPKQYNRAQLCLRAAVILCNLRLCRVTPCFLWQLYDWNSFKTWFEGVKRGERSAFVSHRSAGNTDTKREAPPTNIGT